MKHARPFLEKDVIWMGGYVALKPFLYFPDMQVIGSIGTDALSYRTDGPSPLQPRDGVRDFQKELLIFLTTEQFSASLQLIINEL